MSKIIIGESGHKNVGIDRKILMTTRLLITSDSGGGKTWLLKRLIEQAFGQVGIIVIDPEGEFAPLRTKFDFFLVSKGTGGDTPADIRTAEKVALTLLKGRASAICDIYDMPASERHIWVQRFLDALLEAPKELRHPYLVIVDEAHMFCPEHGKGESVASDAMRGLATRGRKRELCGIYATQRLSSLGKDLTGMCLNRLVGPTFESINQKRAADELGIQKPEQKEFFASVKMLEPGNFYALGRAITKDLELVHIGPIETPHGQEARQYELKPPPPTAKVREWLKELGDLPKQAEEEARTTAEFKKQIRELKSQLRSQPTEIKPVAVADQRAIDRAVSAVKQDAERKIGVLRKELERLKNEAKRVIDRIDQVTKKESLTITVEAHKIPDRKIPGGEIQRTAAPETRVHPRPDTSPNGDLSRPRLAILRALAEFAAIGRSPVPRKWVAARAGASHKSSAYSNNISALRSAGLIEYDGIGGLLMTSEGQSHAPDIEPPQISAEMLDSCLALLSAPQQRILRAVYHTHPEPLDREQLAGLAEASAKSSAFANNVSALKSAGMVDYVGGGVKCSDWLFI